MNISKHILTPYSPTVTNSRRDSSKKSYVSTVQTQKNEEDEAAEELHEHEQEVGGLGLGVELRVEHVKAYLNSEGESSNSQTLVTPPRQSTEEDVEAPSATASGSSSVTTIPRPPSHGYDVAPLLEPRSAEIDTLSKPSISAETQEDLEVEGVRPLARAMNDDVRGLSDAISPSDGDEDSVVQGYEERQPRSWAVAALCVRDPFIATKVRTSA